MAYVVAVRRQLACLVAVVGLNLPVASQFDRLIGPPARHSLARRCGRV